MSEESTYEHQEDLLAGISWNFFREEIDDKDLFLEAVAEYQSGENYRLSEITAVPLSFKKIGVIYNLSIELHAEEGWEWKNLENILLVESDRALTELDILFQIQKKVSPLLSDQDHRFFEGLAHEGTAITSNGERYPIFRMYLGS